MGTFLRGQPNMLRQVVSVSQNAVVQAESEIASCDRCGSKANTPFWQILHSLRSHQEREVVYILPVLAACPNCLAQIDEITLVEPKAGRDRTPVKPSCRRPRRKPAPASATSLFTPLQSH